MTQLPLQPTSNSTAPASVPGNGSLPVVDNVPGDGVWQNGSVDPFGEDSDKSNTLRRQLFTTVLPLTVAPLAVASVVGYGITQRNAASEVTEALEGRALLAEELVSVTVAEDLRLTKGIAVNPLVQSLAQAGSEIVIEEDLRNISPEELESRFSQTKMLEPNQAFNDYLATVAEVENFEEIIVTEGNGFNVGFSQTPSDFGQASDTWWQQGRAQGQWVSDPEFDESVGGFGFTISTTIEDAQTGDFLGVIKGFFSSEEFNLINDYLQELGISGSQQVEIIDVSSGSAIAKFNEAGIERPASVEESLEILGGQVVLEIGAKLSEASQSEQGINLDALQTELKESYPISNLDAKVQETTATALEDVRSEELVVAFNYDGTRYAIASTPLVDWVSVSTIDLAEIRSEGRGFLVLFSLIGVTLAAITSILTIGLSRRLSSPLDDLSNSARQVAAGNLDVMAQLQGTSETQTLAKTFNDLVRRVKGSLMEQTRNAEEANLLAYITGAKVETESDLAAVFDQSVQRVRGLLNVDRVVVYRFNTETWSGRIVSESVESGLPSAFAQGLDDPCIPESVRNKYLNEGIYLHNNVSTAQFHPEHLKLLENLQIRSVVGTPIVSQGRLYGLVIAHHCHQLHTWQPSEINFMKRLGEQLGLVLDRVNLQEQTNRNAEEANLFAYITGAKVDTSEELTTLFDQTVQQIRDRLSNDRVVVYRFNIEDWSGRIVSESVDRELPSAFAQGLDDPCIPESVRERYSNDGIYLHNDVATAQFHPEHLKLLENLKIRSVVGTPIISQGQLYGLVIAHHCHKLHTWAPSEVSFMRRVGQQLGLVLERVTLQEQTQRLASEQQQIKETLQRNALQLLMDVDPVSQGDLTVRAQVTEDEIGTVADSYNATIANLRKIVAQVKEAAQQMTDTTAASEASAQSLSKSALQQAQEISEALDRAQEMANSARLVATNAAKAGEAVQAAALTVREGDDAMNRTVDGILSIRETVAETAKKVKRLGESSQKISNVVNLISGFAAQTNMLALNASIEASRAGEDSKGFAVVAEEVRELARQSAEATTEIEKLVSDIQSETNEVVVAMETGTEQVVSGTKLVDETRESLNKITETSRQISELVESITRATVTQTQASEAVTGVMTNVAAIATRNTTEANQVCESFEDLNKVAQALQSEVDRFKVE